VWGGHGWGGGETGVVQGGKKKKLSQTPSNQPPTRSLLGGGKGVMLSSGPFMQGKARRGMGIKEWDKDECLEMTISEIGNCTKKKSQQQN